MKPIVAAAVVLASLGGGTALAAPGAGEGQSVVLERFFIASDDEVWIANPGNVARDQERKSREKKKKK